MTELLPTFEYDGDKVSAVFEGQVIATGDRDSFGKVACDAEEYLSSLAQKRDTDKKEARKAAATHIVTPNGLEGEILTRTAGVFSDEITVRFSNGQIRRLEVATGEESLKYKTARAEAPGNPREGLEARLASEYAPSREGLTTRINELADVRREAGNLASSAAEVSEQHSLHQIALAAEAEQAEIRDVLAHLDVLDAENATPEPPKFAAVEQVSLGRGARDNWLEVVAQKMADDSEAEDFDKLLSEGPALLVASLDDGAIMHAATVHEVALAHVMAKTAGFQGEAVETYRERFVAATETARRQAEKARKQTVHKQAAAQAEAVADLPDDFLFGV